METTKPPQDDYKQDDRPPTDKLPRKALARPQAILWNTPELAAYLNVKEGTIRYWVHVKYIPYIKFQSLVRFRKTDIDAWLDQRTALGRTPFLRHRHGDPADPEAQACGAPLSCRLRSIFDGLRSRQTVPLAGQHHP